MSERPLTRRELRELERQRAAADTPESAPAPPETVSTPTPESASAPPPEPGPPAPPTQPAVAVGGSQPLSRRELRERARELRAEAESTGERAITRRPVREPTTTSSIPAYGSVHVPMDDVEVPAPVTMEETRASLEAVPDGPAAEATPDEPAAPERVSLFASPTPPADAPPAEREEPEPEPATEPAAEAAPVAREPAWPDLVGEPEQPAPAEPESRGSLLGTVLRYVALVVAFFIIGVLLWIVASGQVGRDSNEPADGPTTVAHGPVDRGDV
nr:hypothetical protein [Actinomycetales bacterium]